MLLHNQRSAAVSWEALGHTYAWEPYGACEVPDHLVPLLKSEGFPVSTTPVPPKEKAERAAAAATEDEKAALIDKLKRELVAEKALVKEAQSATEAAEQRAASARKEADVLAEKLRASEEQLRVSKSDAEGFAKLLDESNGENEKLKQQLKVLSAQPTHGKAK